MTLGSPLVRLALLLGEDTVRERNRWLIGRVPSTAAGDGYNNE